MNVPKLRFKEFTGEWETIPAKDLFENIPKSVKFICAFGFH